MDPIIVLAIVLLIVWGGGLGLGVTGGLIHILLLVAVVLVIVRLLDTRSID